MHEYDGRGIHHEFHLRNRLRRHLLNELLWRIQVEEVLLVDEDLVELRSVEHVRDKRYLVGCDLVSSRGHAGLSGDAEGQYKSPAVVAASNDIVEESLGCRQIEHFCEFVSVAHFGSSRSFSSFTG